VRGLLVAGKSELSETQVIAETGMRLTPPGAKDVKQSGAPRVDVPMADGNISTSSRKALGTRSRIDYLPQWRALTRLDVPDNAARTPRERIDGGRPWQHSRADVSIQGSALPIIALPTAHVGLLVVTVGNRALNDSSCKVYFAF